MFPGLKNSRFESTILETNSSCWKRYWRQIVIQLINFIFYLKSFFAISLSKRWNEIFSLFHSFATSIFYLYITKSLFALKVGVTGEKPLTGIRPVFVWKIQIVIRASRRNGIAPGAVTKAYLPDALIFTVIRLTVSGSTTPASSAELFFFEFNSILETKWLSQTSRTMLQSALFMTTGVFLWLTSAGLVSQFYVLNSKLQKKNVLVYAVECRHKKVLEYTFLIVIKIMIAV